MAIHYLTLGNVQADRVMPTEIPYEHQHRLKTLPKGYPFLPLKSSRGDARDSNPARISRWTNASFQARHLGYFKHGPSTYTVILAVDGVWLRNKHLTMLCRSGKDGTRNPILSKHVGTSVGEQSGVLLSVKGVPMQNYTKLLDNPVLGNYAALFKLRQHFTLIIDGDFPPIIDRTQVSKKALDVLQNNGFLQNLCKCLDRFRASTGVFHQFYERAAKNINEQRTDESVQ